MNNNNFITKTIIDLPYDDSRNYKTNVIPRRDLVPWVFFTPKSFDEYSNENDVKIVGSVRIGQKKYNDPLLAENSNKAIKEKNADGIKGVCNIPLSETPSENQQFDLYSSTPKGYHCIGYASVGNDEFVKLVKYNPWWLLVIPIIALLIICGLRGCGVDPIINPFEEVTGSEITTEAPNYNEYMANNHYLYVWKDKTVSKEKPTVALVNHPDNDVYLCYDILNSGGETLDSTGAFKPNTQIDYDFYNLFNGKKGTYNLTLLIKVYDLQTKETLCSKTMPIVITIE